ncbi:MAG: aminoacyl-tRNA hydrolase [Desulfobacteraceae bacterium]|nr:aminoacyl-tRNA hydrolase [Desulfobacteraceae bacterium]MCF8094859.1 aminoacyl-tRNA hydrolase [Desulfobacteraceae bacterium]
MDVSRWLIAGLGNPGKKYGFTRHNAGFTAAEGVAEHCRIAIDQKKFKAHFGKGEYAGSQIIVAKPGAYMNLSGPPLRQLAGYFNIPIEYILVIHDDIDIEKGRIKIKEKGGHGGHNGIKSIMEAFGSGDFPRLRIGVGRPEPPTATTDYVLGRFTAEEKKLFAEVLQVAEDAVLTIIRKGLAEAMNQFNHRQAF